MSLLPGNRKLSVDETAQLAFDAGFRGNNLSIMIAVAGGESGYNSAAYNPSDPNGGSYGIVQINGSHFHSGGTTQECALDPACALKYAFTLSGGSNFTPWGAFTNGTYLVFMPDAQVAAGKIKGSSVSGSSDPCWKGIADGTPWQNVPVCNPLDIQCFDPGQCSRYAVHLKVSEAGPATSQTGPTQAGANLAASTTLLDTINGLLADPTRLIKGLIGIVLLVVGLVLMIKQLVPPAVLKAVGA